ncbi:MAG: 4'-phosphopantetheinyl transferase superfamily protein [Gemmatimonadaceae bacterium]
MSNSLGQPSTVGMTNSDAGSSGDTSPAHVSEGEAHVWTVSLSHRGPTESEWAILSSAESERARRFHYERHRDNFVLAHAALRQILAEYTLISPGQLEFVVGDAGKPAIAPSTNTHAVEFNLSHSGDLALVAVTRGRAIGVDIEQWDDRVEFLELADHYFSPHERSALWALENVSMGVMQGFFQAWSRKEAYLKATGVGITKGLHHFDVALTPGEPAALIADRNDATAIERWRMNDLIVADRYSAAVVVAGAHAEIRRFNF